ncbi:lipopolysaccharide biosynthesis protein [Zhihengliuella somnathii]
MVHMDGSHARRGLVTTAFSQSCKFLIQMASIVVLARLLTPDDFGTFAMVFAVSGFATVIGDFGLSSAAIQARSLSLLQRSNLWWVSFGIGCLLWAILWLIAPLVEDFFGKAGITELLRVVGLSFVLSAASSQYVADLTRNLRFGWLAVNEIAAHLLAFGAAVGTAGLGAGPWALVTQQITFALVLLVASVVVGRWIPGIPGKAPMKSLVTFGGNTLGVQLLTYFSSNVDSIVLGRVAGAGQLGLYDQAYRLFKVPVQQIASPLTRVALPLLSRRQDNAVEFSRLVIISQNSMSYVLGSVFVLGAVLAEPVVHLLLGGQWTEAVPLFAILAAGGLFQAMGYVYYWTFMGLGLTGVQLRYSLLTRSIMIVAIIVAARWGANGVAVAVAASLALNWAVLSAWPLRQTGLKAGAIVFAGVRSLGVHVAVGAMVFWVDRLLTGGLADPLRLALGLVCGISFYSALILSVPRLRNDVHPLVEFIRSR